MIGVFRFSEQDLPGCVRLVRPARDRFGWWSRERFSGDGVRPVVG